VVFRLLLARRNHVKRRNALTEVSGVTETGSDDGVKEQIGHSHAFDDLTDKENPDFRYVI
jgi:hypothetical protein